MSRLLHLAALLLPLPGPGRSARGTLPRALAPAPTLGGSDFRALRERDTGGPVDYFLPVSVALCPDGTLALCNYRSLLRCDLAKGIAWTPEPPEGVDVWNPTGVACAPDGRLFVANYRGHDVLVLREEGDRLRLEGRLAHPELVSPENVDLSPDGRLVAVADYDGDGVLLFEAGGALRWRVYFPRAHGVALLPGSGRVAATSLERRQLLLLGPDGRRIRETGRPGWHSGEYLWPTTVVAAQGLLAVCDAHTGTLTLLDEDLQEVRRVGGNGPGPARFNMPYGACWRPEGTLLVTDTFKGRLVEVDPAGGTLVRTHSFYGPDHVPGLYPDRIANDPIRDRKAGGLPAGATLGAGYRGYTDRGRKVCLRLPAAPASFPVEWHPDYASLVAPGGQRAAFQRVEMLLSDYYFYFTWAANLDRDGREWTLLGSPQSRDVLAVCAGIPVPVTVDYDAWLVQEDLVSEGLRVPLSRIVEVAAGKYDAYRRFMADGLPPARAFQRSMWPRLSEEGFREGLEASFGAPADRDLARRAWDEDVASAARARVPALIAEGRRDRVAPLCDMLLLHVLASGGR